MIVRYTSSSVPRWTVTHTAADGCRVQSVTEPLEGVAKGTGLLEFAEELTAEAAQDPNGASKARKYRDATKALRRYLASVGADDIPVADFDTKAAEEMYGYLTESGLKAATAGFYCRILRSIYRQAVTRGLAPAADSFAGLPLSTRKEPARPSAKLTEADLERLFTADLSGDPELAQARDIHRAAYLTGLTFTRLMRLRTPEGHYSFYPAPKGECGSAQRRNPNTLRARLAAATRRLTARLNLPPFTITDLRLMGKTRQK